MTFVPDQINVQSFHSCVNFASGNRNASGRKMQNETSLQVGARSNRTFNIAVNDFDATKCARCNRNRRR